ncbi:MAG: class I SAM-dependent methyltransferase [Alphaproteobacteria bacterium]
MAAVTPLAGKMIAQIRKDGPLRLDAFIRMALTDPEHGYYVTAAPIGAAGDFITAPEVSQIFGELIGLWSVDRWLAMGRPDPFLLVELGPGRGVLMEDGLRAAGQASPEFRAAARLHLVETSVTLRADQRARLGHYAPTWHESLDDVPRGPMVAVANEFFDALPIRQLRRFGRGWQEQFVVVDAGERLFGRWRDLDYDAGRDLHPIYHRIPPTIVIEHAPERNACALALGERIAADGGAALVVDYGHRGGGVGSTLQSVRGHDHADVYAQPGVADITTHVDFGALARSAAESGCRIDGALDQGRFLLNLGLAERLEALIRANPDHVDSLRAGAYRLIDEEDMGSLFQVLAIVHPSLGPTPGFQ